MEVERGNAALRDETAQRPGDHGGREDTPVRAAADRNATGGDRQLPQLALRIRACSRYGVRGIGSSRRGIRGESYWLESYSNPAAASTSYAQGVSRVIEKAGAR